MPKLTNRHSLPAALVRFAERTAYSSGGSFRTVSSLLLPPRMAVLLDRHRHEISEDVADRCYSLLGTAVHEVARNYSSASIMSAIGDLIRDLRIDVEVRQYSFSNRLERIGEMIREEALSFGDVLREKRWAMKVKVGSKELSFSGQTDELEVDGGVLYDWKVTTVDAVTKFGRKQEWEERANLYILLLHENGIAIKKVIYIPVFRDWERRRAALEPEYPKSMFGQVELPIWPIEKTRQFLLDRLRLHVEAERTLPLCTAEERWAAGGWRVEDKITGRAKPGGSRFETREQMIAWLVDAKPINFRIVEASKPRRCAEGWCPVAQFCEQWKKDPSNPANHPVGPSGLPIIPGG